MQTFLDSMPLVKRRLIVSEYSISSNTLDIKTLEEEKCKILAASD